MQKGELFYSFYTSGVLYMLFLFSLLESCLFFYVIGDCFRMSLVNVDIILNRYAIVKSDTLSIKNCTKIICIEIKSLRFLRWSQIVTLPPPLSYGRETGGEEG